MTSARPLFVSLLISVAAACAQAPKPDVAQLSRTLLERDSAWAAAASEGKDAEKILSYWSDDAVLILQGQPVYRGKAAIREFITGALKIPGFHIHWVSHDPVFSPDGKMAWMPGETETTLPGPDGKPTIMHSRGLTVWRLDADNLWRCIADTGNEGPPAKKS